MFWLFDGIWWSTIWCSDKNSSFLDPDPERIWSILAIMDSDSDPVKRIIYLLTEGCSKNENSNKSSWKKCTFSGRVFKSALKSRIVHQKKLCSRKSALLPGKFSFLEQPSVLQVFLKWELFGGDTAPPILDLPTGFLSHSLHRLRSLKDLISAGPPIGSTAFVFGFLR